MNIIYKATNTLNGDFYIGKSERSMEYRKKGHESPKSKSYFSRAIRCYGKEYFIWEVIDTSAQDGKELFNLERHYIQLLKPKYNLTEGGEGTLGLKWKEESKQKLSKSKTGIKMSKEFCKAVSKALTGLPRPLLTEEHKRKLSLAKLGKKGPPSKRKGRKFGPLSEEARRNIGNALRGRPLSEKNKAGLSKAHRGKTISQSHRESISNTLKGNIPWNKGIKQKDYIKKEI
jgi:group I intron endonuclease